MLLEQISLDTISTRQEFGAYFYHHDQLGSVRALTNSSDNVENTCEYAAYGMIKQRMGTEFTPFRHGGECEGTA